MGLNSAVPLVYAQAGEFALADFAVVDGKWPNARCATL
jgi:hypothetical protein